MSGRFKMETKNGYPLDEVVSALQKDIRRGNEAESMFWALELLEGNYGQYLWRRLIIIACEDIGLGDPQVVLMVHALEEMAHRATRSWKESPEVIPVGMAILAMCRAKKNRESDDFINCVMEWRKRNWRLKVPEYALNGHTDRGRALHGGWNKKENVVRFYQCEGIDIANRVEIEGDPWRHRLYDLFEVVERDGKLGWERCQSMM